MISQKNLQYIYDFVCRKKKSKIDVNNFGIFICKTTFLKMDMLKLEEIRSKMTTIPLKGIMCRFNDVKNKGKLIITNYVRLILK